MCCVALPCLFVCLTLLASFFLLSHLSFKNIYITKYGCFALFVCLTLLASFFLPSHLSFKNIYITKYGCVFLKLGESIIGVDGRAVMISRMFEVGQKPFKRPKLLALTWRV